MSEELLPITMRISATPESSSSSIYCQALETIQEAKWRETRWLSLSEFMPKPKISSNHTRKRILTMFAKTNVQFTEKLIRKLRQMLTNSQMKETNGIFIIGSNGDEFAVVSGKLNTNLLRDEQP